MFIVVLVVAILMVFGAYRGIRRLLGHGGFYMSDNCESFLSLIRLYSLISLCFSHILFGHLDYRRVFGGCNFGNFLPLHHLQALQVSF